jgi:hypothetical protein
MQNKVSVKVSPDYKNRLMTDGLKLYLQSHPERTKNPPSFDELFIMAVDKYCDSYIIDPNVINFFKKFIPEIFPKEEKKE